MKKAVILARVSTLRQEKEGLSLKEIQLPILRDYARDNGFEIDREFVFSESADRKIRKKFQEMIDYVKSSPDVKAIISFRVDRVTRNFRDAVEMDDLRLECDKELHFVYDHLLISKKSVGRDIQDWDLKVFLAKQTINRLKEDAYNSARTKLENGEWPGPARFGYRNVDIEKNKKWIEVETYEAEVVKKLYEWYATKSYSMLELKNKVREVFNYECPKSKIFQILRDPFYHGIMLYDGQYYPHKYDRIVSKELFDRVQEVRSGHQKKSFKYAGLPYLYRGLIKCSVCGCMITPEKKKGKYVYYHCTQYQGKHEATWYTEDKLTQQFMDVFSKIKVPEDIANGIAQTLKESHEDKKHFQQELMSGYETEHKKYQNRIDRMYEDMLDGSITNDFFEEKRNEYRAKQKTLEAKMSNMREADETYYINAKYILNLASRAKDLFKSSEPEQKRLLINTALQNLSLDDENLHYDWVKPFDTIAESVDSSDWLRGLDSNQQP